jgi:hypothetical protein
MDGYISNKKHTFCGWSRKTLQTKVTCNTRSKSGGRSRQNLQEKLHLIATHPREIIPQDRRNQHRQVGDHVQHRWCEECIQVNYDSRYVS